MERNVHVGGLYDAEDFVTLQCERNRLQRDLHLGIKLSKEISSSLVSFHPPFFRSENLDRALSSKAKVSLLNLLKEEVDHAWENGIRLALESFCYSPFIFNGPDDFSHFVSSFPFTKLGVLLEVGHLYQAKFNLDEAIQTFGSRIFDVHVHDATLNEDFKRATHLPIGMGNIDFPGLVDTLRKIKYDGWLTLEIRGDEQEILKSRKMLENLIEYREG